MRGLADDGALTEAVDRAIAANPDVADKIRDGKVAAVGKKDGALETVKHVESGSGGV